MPYEYLALYQRAMICQAFPAYKIEDLDSAPASILTALELMSVANKMRTSR